MSAGAANLLQRDSEDADSLNTRGVQLLEQGAAAQAGDYFAQALKRSPDDEKALNNMGLSLYARGRTAEALTYYERAVKVNPDNIETYVNMGIALRSRRDFTRAAAVFQKALALNPAHPETLYNYGLLLKDMGQQDASRSLFRAVFKNRSAAFAGCCRQRESLSAEFCGCAAVIPGELFVEKRKLLGEMLIDEGLITAEQLNQGHRAAETVRPASRPGTAAQRPGHRRRHYRHARRSGGNSLRQPG